MQQAAMFAGAQVKGGQSIGASNAAGHDVTDPGWSQGRYIWPEEIEATIYSALGNRLDQGDSRVAAGRGAVLSGERAVEMSLISSL